MLRGLEWTTSLYDVISQFPINLNTRELGKATRTSLVPGLSPGQHYGQIQKIEHSYGMLSFTLIRK